MVSEQFVRSVRLKREGVESFDTYPFSLPAIKNLEELSFHPNVTFLVGENGSGKSTILEALAVLCDFNPEGGPKNFTFSTSSTHSNLYKHMTLVKGIKRPKSGFFLRAETFYNVATEIDRLDEDHSPWLVHPLKMAMAVGRYIINRMESHFSLYL